MKLCINCVNCSVEKIKGICAPLYRCNSPKNIHIDLVTGDQYERSIKNCASLRIGDDDKACGESGKWFEHKEEENG